MNSTLLILPPIVNVIVTGLFAAVVLRQYIQRRRNYQLYWSVALVMAFLATLAYIGMLAAVPTSTVGLALFLVYYALGGTLMPSWLGLGSLALIKPRFADLCFRILNVVSVVAFFAVCFGALNLDTQKLSTVAGTPGTGVLRFGLWTIFTIVLNSLGIIAVAGVALYSGWKLLGERVHLDAHFHLSFIQFHIYKSQPSTTRENRTLHILWANVLIFIGSILDATAGSLARFFGVESTFWLVMAVGWIILFLGVLLASRRSRTTTMAPASSHIASPVQTTISTSSTSDAASYSPLPTLSPSDTSTSVIPPLVQIQATHQTLQNYVADTQYELEQALARITALEEEETTARLQKENTLLQNQLDALQDQLQQALTRLTTLEQNRANTSTTPQNNHVNTDTNLKPQGSSLLYTGDALPRH
jgi:hypothetical protein